MKIGCIVLASGESVRFGSNKLLADFCGKPLLTHLLDALPAELYTIVVARDAAVQSLVRKCGFPCVLQSLPAVRDTIRFGLVQLRGTDGCLFCVGDQPLLRRSTIRAMLDAFTQNPKHIVRAAFQGREGNPVLFPAALYGELASLREDEAGVTVIRRHPSRVHTVEATFAQELDDVDTPETFAALAAWITEQKEC